MSRRTKIDPGNLPPGYDPDKPILAYKVDNKLFCPIPGCKHKGTNNQHNFNRHLKSDHSRCIDPSYIRMHGSEIVYDKRCKVLVCLKHQTVRLKDKGFCEDPNYSTTGTHIETDQEPLNCVKSETLAVVLPPGQAVMGLPILSGYYCNSCEKVVNEEHRCDSTNPIIKCSYQQIKHFKAQHTRPHLVGESDLDALSKLAQEHPAVHEERRYLHRHEFLWRDFQFENHAAVLRRVLDYESSICQAIFELYFYKQYMTLSSDRFVGFRKTLSHDMHEAEPFGTLSDKTAVIRYAKLFGEFGLLLLRNRIFHVRHKVSPLGERASNLMFHVWSEILKTGADFDSIVLKLGNIKRRLPIVQHKINELDRRFASDAVDLSNLSVCDIQDILVDANTQTDSVHRLMVHLLLEDGAQNYTLLQACGYYLRYGRAEQLNSIDAPRFMAAIMFAMKLTCWTQLLRDHDLGYSLWFHSLESTQELGRRFYSLCYDVQKYADTSPSVNCTWVTHGETIAIQGKCLSLDRVRSGLRQMTQDLRVEFRALTFNEASGILVPEDVTNRDHGFSPFPRRAVLTKHVEDLPDDFIDMSQNFLKKLMILVRLCCVGAPRQTEMAMWTFRNTQIFRSIRLQDQVVRIRSDYHKNKYINGRSLSSKVMRFLYVLPSGVSDLLVKYLVYLRPLEVKLLKYKLDQSRDLGSEYPDMDPSELMDSFVDDLPEFSYECEEETYEDMFSNESSDEDQVNDSIEYQELADCNNPMIHVETEFGYNKRSKSGHMMQYYLCHGPDGFWPDYYLYRMHHVLTKQYFGVPIDFNDWRHIYELANVDFEKEQAASEIKSMLSKATGHTELTAAMSYGVDGERSMDVTVAESIKFEFLSQLYHNFLEIDREVRYFDLVREEKHIDIGGDLEPGDEELNKVTRFRLNPGQRVVTALMISDYSFVAVVDDYAKKLGESHYDCRTITDEEMKELEFSWDAVVITNAHLVLKKPELVQELRKIKGDEYQLILVSPLIPNYMFEKFNQVLQMDLPYYRQTYSFGNTIFYKQFTTKLRLLYLFGNIVRRVNMTEGIIVMYCSASAKKFFEAVVPFKRRDFVIFLDADDDDTEAFASKVQLVVHYGNFLSYMLVMNQIRAQNAKKSLWLGCKDDSFKEAIDMDMAVSRQYLLFNGCLRMFHQNHFRGIGMSCRDMTADISGHCSNCRKESDLQWKYLSIPKWHDFDVKLWLLSSCPECLGESNEHSMDDMEWRETVKVPQGHCPECGVCSTDVSGLIREDHAGECRVKYVLRGAILECLGQYGEDWEGIKGLMSDVLRRRGVYRRSSDHQWVDYYTMNEKQIVVNAVEYLYMRYFDRELDF